MLAARRLYGRRPRAAGHGPDPGNNRIFPAAARSADFARRIPDLTIVLNHIGGMMRTGPYANRDDEVIPEWRSGIEAVGACPNVIMKLGGIGLPRIGYDWHERETPIGSEELADSVGDWMRHCLDAFGPDRCMFESNFRWTRCRSHTT